MDALQTISAGWCPELSEPNVRLRSELESGKPRTYVV